MSIPPVALAIFWFAVIAGMLALFFVFVRKWRIGGDVERQSAGELLAEYRALHHRGELSDAEFRQIEEKLGPELVEQAAIESVGSTDDAAQALKQTARSLLAGYSEKAKAAAKDGRAGASDQSKPSDAAGGARREGCDEPPPDGGDSTE